MSISNGQKVDAANSNAAWISRTTDSNTTGKLDLENTDAASGSSVINNQKSLNGQASFSGADPNGAKDQLPVFASNAIGTASDSLKVRQDAVQAAAETLQSTVATNTSNISDNTTDIGDLRSTTGTADNDTNMGTYTGALLNDNESAKQNIQQLETQVETNTSGISGKEDTANKGAANGYCPLDASALVPSANLPSYVDDVLEFADFASFPGTGETGKIYIAIDTNFNYRWSGSVYVDITSKVDSVNTQVGAVVLDADDISDAATTNKYATQAQLDKVDHLTVTQAVDLDTIESDTATNNSKVTFPEAPIDGSQYARKDAGWEAVAAAGGTGQGGINYIKNGDYESGATDYTAPGLTTSLETVDPVRGTQSLKVVIPNTVTPGSHYLQIDMDDVDNIDMEGSKVLTVAFDYSTDANFSTDDVQFVLRRLDATAADIILMDDYAGKIPANTSKKTFTSRVQVDNDANTYALKMNILSAPSVQSTIWLDNIKIGPDVLVPGAIITDPISFTPAWTNLTIGNGTQKASYWREGSNMVGHVRLTFGSTTSVSATPNMTLPDGESINAIIVTNDITLDLGRATLLESGVQRVNGKVMGANSTHLALGYWNASNDQATISPTAPFTWGTGDIIDFGFKVPIEGWSSGAMLSTTEASLSTVVAQASTAATTITAASPIVINGTEDHDPNDVYNSSTGVFTAPLSGNYKVDASIRFNSQTYSAGHVQELYVFINGSLNRVLARNTIDASVTSAIEIQGGILLTGIVKGDAIDIRAYNAVSTTLDGSYIGNYVTFERRPDFSFFSVFGEWESGTVQSATLTPTISGYQTLVGNSVTFEPGTYRLFGHVAFEQTGGTPGYTDNFCLWGSTNGTYTSDPAGMLSINKAPRHTDSGTTSGRETSSVYGLIKVTSPTTVYLNVYAAMATPSVSRLLTDITWEKIQ